jgi:hypothetical protein
MHGTHQLLPFQAPKNIFRHNTEELCSVTTLYTTSSEASELCPALGSREATLSSSKEASSDVAIHDAKECGKKRRNQHH